MIPLNRGLLISLSLFLIDQDIKGKENCLHTFLYPCMGTTFKVSVHSEMPRNELSHIVKGSFKIADKMDTIFSDYSADSEVSKINQLGSFIPQKISSELSELLKISETLYIKTNGAFDPASGALTRLWRLSRKTKKLPDQESIKRAQKASDFNNLIFDKENKKLTKKDPSTRLDFGGIAKGFTADKMLQYMKKNHLNSCSISAGGDIVVGDPPIGKSNWTIKIQPFGDSDAHKFEIRLSNGAVSTSGNVEQFVQIEDFKYSHIINPTTGLGLTIDDSVVVISRRGSISDALATSISILGKNGFEILNHFPNTAAAIIDPVNNKVMKSQNFNKISE